MSKTPGFQSSTIGRSLLYCAGILALAGCSSAETIEDAQSPTEQPAEPPVAEAEQATVTPEPVPQPNDATDPDNLNANNVTGRQPGPAFLNTGWRTMGENGAIYTTYFDSGNVYRDHQNGEPWRTGTWERLPDGRLCFTPDAENRAGGCWSFGEEDSDGLMRATSDTGREIELRRVTYLAPEDDTGT